MITKFSSLFTPASAVRILATALAIGPFSMPAGAATFTVNNTGDSVSAGACSASAPCSLREAVTAVEANPGADSIVFDTAVFATPQIISVGAVSLPTITQDLSITGPAAALTIQSSLADKGFLATAGNFSISNLTVSGFKTAGVYGDDTVAVTLRNSTFTQSAGSGVFISAGSGDVDLCTFSSNASGLVGRNLNVRRSIFRDNTQTGLQVVGESYVRTSTITGSYTGVYASGDIENCTISQNVSGVGSGVVKNCTIAGNTRGTNDYVSGINCIISSNTTDIGYPSYYFSNCIIGGNAGLQSSMPKDNGGPTPTIALTSESPAIDKAGDTGYDTDQRGFPRPRGLADDIGAYEAPAPTTIVVTQPSDFDDGTCTLGDCTLRQAIRSANSDPDVTTIKFNPSAFNSPQTITLGSTALPAITSPIIIQAPAFPVTVKANQTPNAFTVPSGSLSIDNLRFSGFTSSAVLVSGGSASLNNCVFYLLGNAAQAGLYLTGGSADVFQSSFYTNGVGIRNAGGNLTVRQSLLSGNTLCALRTDSGTSTLQNSTVAGGGTGVYGVNTTIQSCTICDASPGINAVDPTLQISNSIVAGNGTLISGSPTTSNNLTGIPATVGLDTYNGLGNLQDHGGLTLTIALLPGSPALNAAGDTGLDVDQRGVPRPIGSADDIGAYELDNVGPNVSITNPLDGQLVLPSAFKAGFVRGTAADNGKVISVSVLLSRQRGSIREYWNGSAFGSTATPLSASLDTPNSSSTGWRLDTVPPPAQIGFYPYTVSVASQDGDGNVSQPVSIGFAVTKESTAPVITVNYPPVNAVISAEEILLHSIGGQATDNDLISSVTGKLYRTDTIKQYWNGSVFGPDSVNAPTSANTAVSSTPWLISPLPSKSLLTPGSYAVAGFARDFSGNTASVTRPFTIIKDTEAPIPSFSAPAVNAHLALAQVQNPNNAFLWGMVTDNVATNQVTIKFYRTVNGVKYFWNGNGFQTTSVSVLAQLDGTNPKNLKWTLENSYLCTQMTPGNYSAQIVAKDAANNSSVPQTRNFTVDAAGTLRISPSGKTF